ncbi:hypothetical protein ACN081_05675 [Rothia sp. P13129]|uniref:hypothetical protein n=1 Tax=Rothia sp. P13129 TaxID=3402664 RepID=UPI003ACE4EE2
MGLFSRRKDKKAAESAATTTPEAQPVAQPAEPATPVQEQVPTPPVEESTSTLITSEELNEQSALHSLICMMQSKGDGQLTLDLKQAGNDMLLSFEENGKKVEETIVVPGNPWFENVAALYTEEEKSPRGAWTRALIILLGTNAQVSYLNSKNETSCNLHYQVEEKANEPAEKTSATEATEVAGADVSSENQQNGIADDSPLARVSERFEAAQSTEKTAVAHNVNAEEATQENSSATSVTDAHDSVEETSSVAKNIETETSPAEENTAAGTVAEPADDATHNPARDVVEESEETSEAATAETGAETGEDVPQGVKENTASVVAPQAQSTEQTAPEAERVEPHARLAVARPSNTASVETAADTTTEATENSAGDAKTPTTNTEASENTPPVPSEDAESATHHSDAETFTSAHDISLVSASLPEHVDDEWEEEEPDTLIGSSATNSRGTDLPEAAQGVDVAPSYNNPTEEVQPPSTTELAEGNLVLTEAQVVARLLKAQEQLFGENGTARDVSTVLIRVRALGSYYDALTHVRRNGFWDQQRTFDLIPEDVLAILQLKADSYKEGAGSPLAMSLRFTPGIPPVASFSYNDEGAFAKYQDTLPAQQYVEELRLFPRTGANIPEHMNRALASWTL